MLTIDLCFALVRYVLKNNFFAKILPEMNMYIKIRDATLTAHK